MNILSYNICGIKNKVKDPFFIKFINNYDIVCFCETFLEDKDKFFYSIYFQNYKLVWVPATRISKFGRGMGGMLICCKTELISKDICKFIIISGIDLLEIKISATEKLHLLPIYLGPNNWKENFNLLYELIVVNSHLQFLLIGDWNARLGDGQCIGEGLLDLGCCSELRQTRDKTVNSEGKMLLDFFDDNGFVILNGRSPGDLQGEYTYIGPRGCSVIDLAAISISKIEAVRDFSV